MPELPEVEANARNLRRWAVGKRLLQVQPPPGTRETGGTAPRDFVRLLKGRDVVAVDRRGKWILCRLSGEAGLALHLGMTGKLAHLPQPGEELPRFTRAVFSFEDTSRVCFVDSRRFGRLLPARGYDELVSRPTIAAVGPDALTDLDAKLLQGAFAGTRRTVKETLLDQRVAGGIGNLYATEALWRARIHPATPAPSLPRRAITRLVDAIRTSLEFGLAQLEGVDLPQYLEDGAPNPFFCYDRAGEPCPRCKTTLSSMVIGGRTSAFCPRCQPAP